MLLAIAMPVVVPYSAGCYSDVRDASPAQGSWQSRGDKTLCLMAVAS